MPEEQSEVVKDFPRYLDGLLREFYYRALVETDWGDVEPVEDPRIKGYGPMYEFWDEMPIPSWTPAQFNRIWDAFGHEERVRFVRSLLR